MLSITAIVILVAAVSGVVNVKIEERQFQKAIILGADQLTKGIVSATWQFMLDDHRDAAYQVMQTIALKQGVDHIRMFNRAGQVVFSTNPPDRQTQASLKSQTCALCHAEVPPRTQLALSSRVRIYGLPDGHRRLAMVTPIYNERACSQAACHAHPEGVKVLGVLDLALNLESVDHEVDSMKLRVLLVTGDVVEQRALRSILGQLGHEATVAADGATAEDVLAAETVDVVIGDWQLPDVDGIELCRRVRARHDRDYTYFILLTAGGDRSQARRGMEAGADDYLAKPLDAEALDIALIAAARISALHREQRAAQLQQGRLEGVRLAARTMRHELGNKLAATVLYHELLAERADDTTELHAVATKALRSVREATTLMDQLGRVTRLDVINWGPDAHSTLELVGARA